MSARNRPRDGARPWRRTCGALAIVAALIAACCAIDAVLDALRPGVGRSVAEAVLASPAAEAGGLAGGDAALDALPDGFAEEVLDLSQAASLDVAAGGEVIGFTVPGEAAGVFASLGAELAANGWSPVESGSDAYGTFVKDEGRFTWMLVSCTQVSETVSVVLQCPAGDAG